MLDPEGHKKTTARNRKGSAEILRGRGIEFSEHNRGAHLIIFFTNIGFVDFWPGTGKFIVRESGRCGRGVRNLLKLCEVRHGN